MMDYKMKFEEANTFKDKGGTATELIDKLSSEKIYHSLTSLIVCKTYNLELDDVETMMMLNEFYKNQISKKNPFNKDFFDSLKSYED